MTTVFQAWQTDQQRSLHFPVHLFEENQELEPKR